MENKYNYIGKKLEKPKSPRAYFKDLFGSMHKYAKLVFSNNLIQEIEKLKKEHFKTIETKVA